MLTHLARFSFSTCQVWNADAQKKVCGAVGKYILTQWRSWETWQHSTASLEKKHCDLRSGYFISYHPMEILVMLRFFVLFYMLRAGKRGGSSPGEQMRIEHFFYLHTILTFPLYKLHTLSTTLVLFVILTVAHRRHMMPTCAIYEQGG